MTRRAGAVLIAIVAAFVALVALTTSPAAVAAPLDSTPTPTPNPYTWTPTPEPWDEVPACNTWSLGRCGVDYDNRGSGTSTSGASISTMYSDTGKILAGWSIYCPDWGGSGNANYYPPLTLLAATDTTQTLDAGNVNQMTGLDPYFNASSGNRYYNCVKPQAIWSPYTLPDGKPDLGIRNGDFDVPYKYWSGVDTWYGINGGPDGSPGRIYWDGSGDDLSSDTYLFGVTATIPVSLSYQAYYVAGKSGDIRVRLMSSAGSMMQDTFNHAGVTGAWQTRTITASIEAGTTYTNYWVYVDRTSGDAQAHFDNFAVTYAGVQSWTNPITGTSPVTWGVSAWIYHPVEMQEDNGKYKVYSETDSYYGESYTYYNIWDTDARATAYAIANMEIVEVGTNVLGYYVRAQIDAWPDIQSTTLQYEGLQSVDVDVGDRVKASCPVGTVGYNPAVGRWHLLLGVWFPDADTPMDPRPWFSRRPSADLCPTGPAPPTPPGPTPGEGGLWDPVCRDCVAPGLADILSIGKWIDWLGCVVSNLILCWIVRLINSVIAFLIGIWEFIALAVGWLWGVFSRFVDWLGNLYAELALGVANYLRELVGSILELELVQWLWSSVQMASQFIGTAIEVGIALVVSLLGSVWDMISLGFDVLRGMIDIIGDVFSAEPVDIMDVFGFDESGGGAASGAPSVNVGGATGTLDEQLSVGGKSAGKVVLLLVWIIYVVDYTIGSDVYSYGFILLKVFVWASLGWVVFNWTRRKLTHILESS